MLGAVSYCCSKVVCILGFQKYGPNPPCPALVEHDGRFWCGLVENAKGMEKEELIAELAIDAGCTSTMFNTVRDSQIAKMKEKEDGKTQETADPNRLEESNSGKS